MQNLQRQEEFDGLHPETQTRLAENGYTSLTAVKAVKKSRQEWIDFAERIGVPDRDIHTLAPKFGPDFTFLKLQSQIQPPERLAMELRAWFGHDFDRFNSYNQNDFVQMDFLIHDTYDTMAQKIQQEGILRTTHADDQWYDGALCRSEAPAVVFFQASEYGGDMSIYPRDISIDFTQKRRILVDPTYIGLHTDSYRYYLVRISESRERPDGMLQMHLLFVPRDHKCIPFCDANFLIINKKMFQPFHYDKTRQKWFGSNYKTANTFGGRGVKLNVCIAQNIHVPKIPDYREDLVEATRAALDGWSMAIPPQSKKVLCPRLCQNACPYLERCNFYHPSTAYDMRIPFCCPRCKQVIHEGPDGMQEHMKVCRLRPPLWCETCREDLREPSFEQHANVCSARPIRCCGCHLDVLPGARRMFEHNKVCPRRPREATPPPNQ